MAAAVEQAFQRGTHLIAEAGTGVGKSFAYLVPAIAQAALGKKVVISTHTISLQEQLIEKGHPFLAGRQRTGILGGALQGPGQLLVHAASRAGRQKVLQSAARRPQCRRSHHGRNLGQKYQGRQPLGPPPPARLAGLGQSLRRARQTAWADAAGTTMAASTRPRAGASPTAKSSSAITPCSFPTWPSRA